MAEIFKSTEWIAQEVRKNRETLAEVVKVLCDEWIQLKDREHGAEESHEVHILFVSSMITQHFSIQHMSPL